MESIIKEIDEQTSFFLTHEQLVCGPDTAYGSKLTEIYKRQYDIKEEPDDDQDFLIKEDTQARKIQETITSLGQFIDQDLKDIKKLRMYLYKIKEDLRKRRKENDAAEK